MFTSAVYCCFEAQMDRGTLEGDADDSLPRINPAFFWERSSDKFIATIRQIAQRQTTGNNFLLFTEFHSKLHST